MSEQSICGAKTKQGQPCRGKPMTNGRCRLHGGLTPGGIASPHFKQGRWSKYIPKGLAASYEEYRNDPDLLSLNDDVALLRSITSTHLKAMEKGDTSPAWIEAKKAFDEMEAASLLGLSGLDKFVAAKARLQAIIEPNYRAAIAEGQVVRNIDQLSKVVDKERRLLLDKQQFVTVERVLLFVTTIIMAVRESVLRHCDRETANRILSDVQDAYSRATGINRDMAVIDAGN